MIDISDSSSKIEIISEGSLNQPALVRIGQQDHIAFEHDPNTILVLEEVAQNLLLKDLPSGIALTPCKRVQLFEEWDPDFGVPIPPSQFEGIAPFRVCYLGKGRAGVIFSWRCTKCSWSNESGYRWKLQRAREAVLARRKSLANLRFHRFIDDGYLAGVEFIATIKSVSMEAVIQAGYEICKGIHTAIEESVRRYSGKEGTEANFIRETLIPLLKKLGFKNVAFHHGPREFGRDILFTRQTEFGIPEYWAAQVKLGNVSGKSNSYIDQIVNQAQEAFKIPLHDIQSKSKLWISKFVVIITGRFSENAVQKICEKIETHSLKNNILFLDGEKIQELIEGTGLKKQPQVLKARSLRIEDKNAERRSKTGKKRQLTSHEFY